MVIDKNKPLPSHTKLKYRECYAKIVLEEMFPDKFINLLLADKPDLHDINGSVGIEVTIAEDPKELEASRLYSQLPYKNEIQKARDIERIESLGAKVYDGFMMSVKWSDGFKHINTSISSKCKTLAKGEYKGFNEYHLFLFSSIYAVDWMLQVELEHLIAKEIGKFYRIIYILVPSGLYVFDLLLGIYKIFDIDSTKQNEQSLKARQMVEEGEEDATRI